MCIFLLGEGKTSLNMVLDLYTHICIYSEPLLKSGPILDKILGTDPRIEEPEPVTLLDFTDKNWDRNTFQWKKRR